MKSGVWQSESDVSYEVVSWSDSFLNVADVPVCIWIRFLSWITHWSFQPEAQFPIKVRNKVPLISIRIKAWLFICQDLETNTSVKSFNQVLFAKRRSVVWYLLELDLNYNPLSNAGLSTLSHLIFYNPHCSQGYIMDESEEGLEPVFCLNYVTIHIQSLRLWRCLLHCIVALPVT